MRQAFTGQVCSRHVLCSPGCPPKEEVGELLRHKVEGKKNNQPSFKKKRKKKSSSTVFLCEGSYLLSPI